MTTSRKSPLARAMDAKRRRWEAEHELDGMGWGLLPEWQTPEFLDWSEIYERAKAEHRKHITTAWLEFLSLRPTFGTRKPAYQNSVLEQA